MKSVLFLMMRSVVVILLLVNQTAFSQSTAASTDLPEAGGQSQPASAGPQNAPPPWAIPHYRLLREEEDWSYLADPQLRGHDWADPLKYISLRPAENWYLTIGGEVREWYERYRNEKFGEFSYFPLPGQKSFSTNGYLKQRYMLGADFHLGNRFRAFTELHSGTVNGKEPAPLPVVDKNKLDFNQAFFDINLLTHPQGSPKLTLRLGRQQLHFGTGRLVSIREVPNLRAGFDGARVILNTHNWRIDAFATKPVFTKDGFFDDRADHTQTFWGIFGTGPVRRLPFNVDGYYFGLRRKFGAFAKGIGAEERHTVGGRIWRGGIPFVLGEGWDYDVEYAGQFGSFGPGIQINTYPFIFGFPSFVQSPTADTRAWTVSTQTGYTFNDTKLQPRIALNTGITSGDQHPDEPKLGTFFTPFPNGRFFGVIQTNGPLNVQGLRPSVTIQLPGRASFTADSYFFWRQSINDALYDVPGFPLRYGLGGARYIGAQPGAEFFWPVTKHISVDANYAYFLAGKFLHENPPDKDLSYVGLILFYRF
jgi:hypothetical protein